MEDGIMKEYFSHDFGARNDPKLIKVLRILGQEGKGVFWDLIEMMYEQNGKLMLSECDSYAFALRTSCELVTSLVNDFDLFVNDGNMFWSLSVMDRLSIRDAKSVKASESAKKRWENKNAMRTHSEGNAIKVKESKVNTTSSVSVGKPTTIKKSLKEKEVEFGKSLTPFVTIYGKEMIREFFDHWTEPNHNKTMMRFEKEKTWDVSRRLAKWNRNDFTKTNKQQKTNATRIEAGTEL